MTDVVAITRQIIAGLVAAGCRYIQIDAPGYTAYVDKVSLDRMRSRGEDPDENLARSIAADNAVIVGFDGVTFGIHLCKGNPRTIDPATGKVDAAMASRGPLRRHRRAAVLAAQARSHPARIRRRALRQLCAAALHAKGQGRGAGASDDQACRSGKPRSVAPAHRRGDAASACRAARARARNAASAASTASRSPRKTSGENSSAFSKRQGWCGGEPRPSYFPAGNGSV